MSSGDFYFAINATFRFIHDRFGMDGLRAYWRELGRDYFRPLSERFRDGGLPAVEAYWRDFFRQQPCGAAEVIREPEQVRIEVRDCPALRWLRDHNRDVFEHYCDHCRYVSEEIADQAGMRFELEGGGGQCRQRFISGRDAQP